MDELLNVNGDKKEAKQKKTAKEKKLETRNTAGFADPAAFEQDTKRRIGQYGGTGEPPIMQ